MIQVVTLTTDPVDLFEAAGLGTGGFGTARTPGTVYKSQNIGQETARYASAPAKPTDLSAGFRLGAGGGKGFYDSERSNLGLDIFRGWAVGHGGIGGTDDKFSKA